MQEVRKTTLPIIKMAKENEEFRQVIWTGDNTQLVLMAIPRAVKSVVRFTRGTTSYSIL
ncbi:hypothetical protein [Vreelandella azerica]|uniref:hypothetical protein n=1 Tax=Vreelandella azerica TaxID=2732867 RepID=UPI001C10504E|nr:hypothetical protein [Halomonas azerica]